MTNTIGTTSTTNPNRRLISVDEQIVQLLSDDPDLSRQSLMEFVRSLDPLLDRTEVAELVDRSLSRAHGLGPLAQVLDRPDLTEVMINGPGPVWVDGPAGLEQTEVFLSAQEIGLLIERILDPLGLRVDRTSPLVDARLADGSRVNVVVPPLAIDGPVVTIRRFSARSVPLEAFVDSAGAKVLGELITQHASILVVGGTGAGKTTLLNAMAALIPQDSRVVTIEDTAELRLPGRHVVRMEARPANSEGVGAVTLRQLVRNALRMRPDRMVVGEVRGGEALDLLLALNTGHRGSLMTCHANSAQAGLRRLETLCLMGGLDLPLSAIREQIASGLDAVVHLARSPQGKRRIIEIGVVEDSLQSGDGEISVPLIRTLWRCEA